MRDVQNLLGLDQQALIEQFALLGQKPFRAKQVLRWVHHQGVSDFDQMSNLAKDLRRELTEHFEIATPEAIFDRVSKDGTRKWLFDIGNNNAVETVFIPEKDRGTLCVSSQAGCTVGCRFCSTGHQGFNRNLTTAEIIAQLWYARDCLTQSHDGARLNGSRADTASDQRIITNVVMMGMGEPLLNYHQLLPALRLMLDDHGYGMSRRRVTVSTSGVVPFMDQLAHDCPVALAVSLHAPNDELRDQLVPLNKKYPLQELLDACNRYLEFAPRDFITFEYIMLDGINDTDRHAEQLIDICRQVSSKLNLIPFNPFPQSGLKRSSDDRIKRFCERLLDAGIVTTVRKTRGDDIDAACGQLAGDVKDRTKLSSRMQQNKSIPIVEVKYGE